MDQHRRPIEVVNCTVAIGRTVCLRETTLAVDAGETVAVMGPSGSGKSTLFRALRGDVQPSSGTAELLGVGLGAVGPRKTAAYRRAHVSEIYQDPKLLMELSVVENVAMPALLAGHEFSEATRVAEERLEDVGLAMFVHESLHGMSGGERQRVAVARALARPVDVILADEPTASLDATNALVVATLLCELAKESSASLLMATHDRSVAACCDRIVELR